MIINMKFFMERMELKEADWHIDRNKTLSAWVGVLNLTYIKVDVFKDPMTENWFYSLRYAGKDNILVKDTVKISRGLND